MQTAPQPAAKQKRLRDDQVHVQGTALFRYLPSEALYCFVFAWCYQCESIICKDVKEVSDLVFEPSWPIVNSSQKL